MARATNCLGKEIWYDAQTELVKAAEESAPWALDDDILFARTDRLCLVLPKLYLSSQHAEADLQLLRAAGVTHVLQVGQELESSHPNCFFYNQVHVDDEEDEDLVVHLPECIDFIDKGRQAGGVLVHCAAGISRSASVVMAYLMARQGLTLAAARRKVREARSIVCPNPGFMLQLQMYERAQCSTAGWVPWSYSRLRAARSTTGVLGSAPSSDRDW